MDESKQLITLTPKQFNRLRPISGHIVVKSSLDMTTVQYKELKLYVDTSFKPERHQEIINVVEKIPDNRRYSSPEYESTIMVEPGDRVIVNYFPILQAPLLEVDGQIYRVIPYYWVICKMVRGIIIDVTKFKDSQKVLDQYMKQGVAIVETKGVVVPADIFDGSNVNPHHRDEVGLVKSSYDAPRLPMTHDDEVGKIKWNTVPPQELNTAIMLNDFIMVDKISLEQHDIEIEANRKTSLTHYRVIHPNYDRRFNYKDRPDNNLVPNAGDVVVLRDSSVFPLEDDLHLHFDGEKHYVARLWKVLSIDGPPPKS